MIHSPSAGGKHRPKAKPFSFSSRGAKRDGGGKEGFFHRWWWLFVLVPVVLIVALAATLAFAYANTKVPDAPPGPQTTFVFDRNGKLITTLHTEVDRTIVPYSQIPVTMREAVIAIEGQHGRPIDMEWTFAAGRLSILQARPITAAKPARAADVQAPGAVQRIWDRIAAFFKPWG